MEDLRAGLLDRVVEPLHAFLELREASCVERLIDTAVHAIAGDDKVGPRYLQHAVKPLSHVGPGEFAAGMAIFREAGDGLARQTHVDDLRHEPLGFHPGGKVGHPDAAVGDRVAEEDDSLGRFHEVDRLVVIGSGGD